ncbi:hypothetical protein K0M31_002382 [Melipona bicolor]|uniref:Secreted protein n=1 Tax=Melipona bicolor TaxID=60889 RepID=A0AA40GHG1_9HYME|nr:hypothetical protein K0M31_002382 [Melipona bicolor]
MRTNRVPYCFLWLALILNNQITSFEALERESSKDSSERALKPEDKRTSFEKAQGNPCTAVQSVALALPPAVVPKPPSRRR